MLHGLNKNNWRDKVLKLGLLKKLSDAKISGKIKHIGFSFHDSLSVFKEIADYTDIWEFCQIQLNYIDTKFQAGIEGLKYASGKGLGVAVMEPLRGGYLSTLPESVSSIFKSAGISKSPTELALDYLWDMPEVSVVLSGMSDSAMACENITFASRSEAGMLSEPDSELYKKAAAEFEKASVIPCTGCNYCNVCPMGITIPYNFMVYNSYMISGDMDRWKEQYENQVTMFGAKASECIPDLHSGRGRRDPDPMASRLGSSST